jgi:capsular polysaccharide biosynthesis protein
MSTSAPDLDAEREVDFGAYARTIGSRWWIVLAALVAGALIGWLLSLGGGSVYRAKATIYLGQPISPTGSQQIQSLATNPQFVNQVAKAESTVQTVAGRLGVKPGKLRSGISTGTVAATAKSQANPLSTVTVRGLPRQQTAQAANMISGIIVREASGYVDAKIASLREEQQAQAQEVEALDRQIEELTAALDAGKLQSDTNRHVLVSALSLAQQRRSDVVAERVTTSQALSVARFVERSRVIAPAAALKVNARSSRSSIVVGGLIGLIIGIALALLWDPVLRRRARAA